MKIFFRRVTYCNLILLAGCQLGVIYSSDPPGASLYQGNVGFGQMPVNVNYRVTLNGPFMTTGCMTLQPVIAIWPDGSRKEVSNITACKQNGYSQAVLIKRDPASKSSIDEQDVNDAAICKKYGFKEKTNEYARCRMQIDQARKDAIIAQAKYAQDEQRYNEQIAAYKKQQDRAAGLALMGMGLGMASNAQPGGYASQPPIAPIAPTNLNRTYMLPGGKIMNCSTTGSITSCL